MYSESRKRKRLLDRLIDTRHHEDRSTAAARRGLRLRFVTLSIIDYPFVSPILFLSEKFPFSKDLHPLRFIIRVYMPIYWPTRCIGIEYRIMLFFFFDLELDYSRVRSSLDNWFDKDRLVGTVPILFFFFSRLESSRWFVFQRVFFVRRGFSSSHSRFLGGNVDYDVRCIQKGIRGRWSRTRDFKIIRPSFSIISPSFYLRSLERFLAFKTGYNKNSYFNEK